MSYRVQYEDKIHAIIEKATELTVASYESKKDAKDACRNLNLGSGFNGITPAFFCLGIRQVKKKGN